MNTMFPDISDHNPPLHDRSILTWRRWSKWISFRVCDGTYSDKNFLTNAQWTRQHDAEILGKINYLVFPPSENDASWLQTFALYTSRLEGQRPAYLQKVVAMIDVESWGRWHTDKSHELNELYHNLVTFLHSQRPLWQRNTIGIGRYFWRLDHRRVIGYGNAGDLNTLWKKKPAGLRIVLANYESNPPYPGKIIHQFTDHYEVPGLGFVDMNSADRIGPRRLAAKLGLISLVRRVL